jgi:hypothetical protein
MPKSNRLGAVELPIALLLTALSTSLADVAGAFGRWNSVLQLETVVIDRARGAFLVNWFGTRLPRSDGRLRIVIDNIEALGERYREARSRSMGGQTGPNLLEPLAGMAGMAAGMFISPSGALMYLYGAVRWSSGPILATILTITHSLPMTELFTGLGTAVAVVLFPLAFIGGIILAAVSAGANNSLTLAFEALGDATRMVQALTRLINLFTGPREAIRNPLLRSILELFDRIAALFAQLIGAAAWMITRVGRLILPLAIQFRAMQQLGEFTIDLAQTLLRGTFDVLARLWLSEEGQRASPWAIVLAMFDHAMAMARRMVEGAGAALTELSRQITERFAQIADNATAHIRLAGDTAKTLIDSIPLIRTFRAAAAMATAVHSIVGSSGSGARRASPPPSSTPSPITTALAPAALVTSMLTTPPPPSLASARAMVGSARSSGRPVTNPWGPDFTSAMAAPFELSADAQALARRLIAPPASVFTDERRAISEELGGRTPEEALEALRTHELRYRDLLYTIVGRVLPPQARAYIPELLDAFNAIDRYIYDRSDTPEAPSEFPVLDLPDNGRLRPVVRRLVVRSAGSGDEVSLRNISADLTRLLREQTYLAPAG